VSDDDLNPEDDVEEGRLNPAWLRIARDYPDNVSGPTLPFIIGAIRDPIGAARTPEEDRHDLHELLLAMDRGAPDKSTVIIRWCVPTREYIAEVHPEYFPTKYNTVSAKPVKHLDWRIEGEDVPDLEALESFLWRRYEGPLSRQEFSWVDRDWHELSPDERAKIQATLNDDA
jgi:hypothetical protein